MTKDEKEKERVMENLGRAKEKATKDTTTTESRKEIGRKGQRRWRKTERTTNTIQLQRLLEGKERRKRKRRQEHHLLL
eukprot:3350248-Amphidinium_carterae.1